MDKKLNLLFKDHKILSLGWNCSMKLFKNTIVDEETHYFDWLGIDPYAIYNLLKNDFKSVFKNKNYKYYYNDDGSIMKINNNPVIYDILYNIRYVHQGDFLKYGWNNFEEQYLRRILRLKNTFKCNNKKIFMYMEDTSIKLQNKLYISLQKNNISELNNYENSNKIQKLKKITNFQKKYMLILDKYITNNYNFKYKIIYFIVNNIIFIKLKTELTDNISPAYMFYLNKLLREPKIYNKINELIN